MWLFPKTFMVSISMSSDHKDGNTMKIIKIRSVVGSIETWGKLTFCFLRCSAMACHKRNCFNSREFILDFIWNCCRLLKAKKFSRNPCQFKWVTRETRHHLSIPLKLNHMSQVAELFQRPGTMQKILYFSGDYQFFQKSLGIKFLYDHGRKFFSAFGWGDII